MIREELNERLDILLSAELISSKVYGYSKELLDMLETTDSTIEHEKSEIFITHFAMALSRVENGEDDFEIDNAVIDSLKDEDIFSVAKDLLDRIITLVDFDIPLGERNLLLIHICNILKKGGEK